MPIQKTINLHEASSSPPRRGAASGRLRTSLLMASVVAALGLRVRRSIRARREGHRNHEACRLATERSQDYFFILAPLRDAARRVDDFEIIDCNRQGAALGNSSKTCLLGRRFSSLYREDKDGRVGNALRHALADGAFEGDIEMNSPADEQSHCMHMRAVASGNRIAVTLRDVSEAKAHLAALEYRSNHDALTGLPNRHWLHAYLPLALKRAREEELTVALLFVDLDGFKSANDTMGHSAGDELLRHAAVRLKDAVRPHDNVVRIGGDEFVVIMENNIHMAEAAEIAQRVLSAFRPEFKLLQGKHRLGASIGISVFPEHGEDAGTLIQRADVAMYSVKTSGKNNFNYYNDAYFSELKDRHHRQHELRLAIDRDEFAVFYQPRANLNTGHTTGLEALVRWQHPARGLIEPEQFIGLAEETGLIFELGELIINKIAAQIAKWRLEQAHVLPVSVNISCRQLNESDVDRSIMHAMLRHQLEPKLLAVEMTEAAMLAQSPGAALRLRALRERGFQLTLDDFGIGHSSLAQLQQHGFDTLKIDRTLVSNLAASSPSKTLMGAIITMAHALGMRVIASGMETRAQLAILQELQCDEVQGFLVGMPLPASRQQPEIAGAVVQRRAH